MLVYWLIRISGFMVGSMGTATCQGTIECEGFKLLDSPLFKTCSLTGLG